MKRKSTRMWNQILSGALAFAMVCGAALGNLGAETVLCAAQDETTWETSAEEFYAAGGQESDEETLEEDTESELTRDEEDTLSGDNLDIEGDETVGILSGTELTFAESDYETYGDENLPVFAEDITIHVTATGADLSSGIESITAAVTVNGAEVDADEVLYLEDGTISGGVIYTVDQSSCSSEELADDAVVNMSFAVNADAVTASAPGSSAAADVNTVVVTVIATDRSGNSTSNAITFYVDQNDPEVTITSDVTASNTENGVYYFNTVRTITVTVTEATFDEADAYATLTNGTDVTRGNWSHEGSVHTITYIFGVEEHETDEDYTFAFVVQDQGGNSYDSTDDREGEASIPAFTVDMTLPVLEASYREAGGTNTDSFSFLVGRSEAERSYADDTVYAELTITERNFSADGLTVTIDGVETSGSDYTWEETSEAVWTATVTFAGDRNYVVTYSYADLAKNTAEDYGTDYFTVDKTVPTGTVTEDVRGDSWDEFFVNIMFGIFTNNTMNVEITAKDLTAGVDEFSYYISDTELSYDELEALGENWVLTGLTGSADEEVSKTITLLTMNQTYVVYTKIVDRSGWTVYLNSDGMVLDDTDPVPTITITTPEPLSYIYDGDVEVTISIVDPDLKGNEGYSGLASVKWEIFDGVSETATQSGYLTVTEGTGRQMKAEADITIDAAKNNTNTVSVKVTAVDNAGNEYVGTLTGIQIDTTAPTIALIFDNNDVENGSYYDTDRTATIVVTERNFDASQLVLNITNTEGPIPDVSGWSTSDSGDATTYTATVTFSSDGDYTLSAYVTDMAGNRSETVQADDFTVDQTDPTVEITGVANESANKGTVAPIITISDGNFDASTVMVTLTGANSGEVDIAGMASVSDTDSGVIYTFRDFADGMDDIYTLTATATDLAGNRYSTGITFSVNRDGSTYSLSSYTKELIEKGVTNNPQNLVITEINLNALIYYTITYTRSGSIRTLVEGEDYDVEVSGGYGGWYRYVYTIYASAFEEEGEYSVTITSVDEAENTTSNKGKETVISFTVDKTGPVIAVSNLENHGRYAETSHDYTVSVKDNVAVDTVEIYLNEELAAVYTAEDLGEGENLLELSIASSNSYQIVSIMAYDTAGNEGVTDNYRVLVTANPSIQSAEEKTLPYSAIAILLLLLLLAVCIIWRTNKKRRGAANGEKEDR